MVDIGHTQTEEILSDIETRLSKEYAQAYKEVEKKAAEYFKRFEEKDKAKKKLVDSGELSKKEYQVWRRNQMLTGKRWTDLCDQLAKDLTNSNQIASGIVRGELNEVFAINANYSEYLIENGMRTNYGFTLYDRNTIANLVKNDPDIIPWKPVVDIPADLRWNRQMITSHITQGILQGESIPNLSKRLAKAVNNDKVAAVRTARTAVTSSQNAGRQIVYDRAKGMGLKLQKEWLATLDGRTRHEHGAVDGQRVPLDGEFTVGGYKMKYPGDMSAPTHLVYNCRCTTITVEPDYITKGEEPRMSYNEWIESKRGKDANKKEKDAEKQAREKERIELENLKNAQTIRQIENEVSKITKANIELSGTDVELMRENMVQLVSLGEEYGFRFSQIVSTSAKKYLGEVTRKGRYGDIVTMQYPKKYYKSKSSLLSELRKNSERGEMPIIPGRKISVYTTTHEFAHTLSEELVSRLYGRDSDFWDEIEDVYSKYKKSGETVLGKYATSNQNEFMAEAFAYAKIGNIPNQYADEVLSIIDKYFKRNKK